MWPTPVANPAIPTDTSRVATALWPEGHRLRRLRDPRGPRFPRPDCAQVLPALGPPARDPAGLALVTVGPWLAGRSDRHAAAPVRRGLAWP
jgi:hypothetical protein